ncbi:MAG: hypothetical protein NVS9B15_08200 [Acidobacteriaceae bacterium]
MNGFDKKLNEMNRLADLTRFPALVNAGATFNVLITLSLTFLLVPRYPQPYAAILWTAVVLTLNLLPVVLLRFTLKPCTVYRRLREMDFVHDQHKFSDWVYLAASANMAFWILTAWAMFAVSHTPTTLVAALGIAGLVTFSPVLVRLMKPVKKVTQPS